MKFANLEVRNYLSAADILILIFRFAALVAHPTFIVNCTFLTVVKLQTASEMLPSGSRDLQSGLIGRNSR
jgi:hypothetical protein